MFEPLRWKNRYHKGCIVLVKPTANIGYIETLKNLKLLICVQRYCFTPMVLSTLKYTRFNLANSQISGKTNFIIDRKIKTRRKFWFFVLHYYKLSCIFKKIKQMIANSKSNLQLAWIATLDIAVSIFAIGFQNFVLPNSCSATTPPSILRRV